MTRSSALKVQTPGAAPKANDVSATQPAQEQDGDAEQTVDLTKGAGELESLRAKLAAAEAKNAELQANLASKAKSNIVYEPLTPHGKERLESSATRSMTVAQVQAAIDDGTLAEPITNYLCLDGHYCRRA